MPSRPGRASVVLLAGFASAACATARFTQSAVVAVPTGVRGHTGSKASLDVGGLKLRIETLDRVPEKAEPPRLSLRVTFDPPALGYSFDPGQVVLRSADGREWRGSGSGHRPVYPKATCVLVFDAAVPPDATLELVLGGLARGQKPLEPVVLRVARRSGTSIERLYWLEFIGSFPLSPTG